MKYLRQNPKSNYVLENEMRHNRKPWTHFKEILSWCPGWMHGLVHWEDPEGAGGEGGGGGDQDGEYM